MLPKDKSLDKIILGKLFGCLQAWEKKQTFEPFQIYLDY